MTRHQAAAAPQRVVTAQRHASVTLGLALLFALAAAVSMAIPARTDGWLPLHLFLVGSLLLAISGRVSSS